MRRREFKGTRNSISLISEMKLAFRKCKQSLIRSHFKQHICLLRKQRDLPKKKGFTALRKFEVSFAKENPSFSLQLNRTKGFLMIASETVCWVLLARNHIISEIEALRIYYWSGDDILCHS